MTMKQIAQVFPDQILTPIDKLIRSVPWRYGWASNKSIEFTHWNHDFTSAPVYNTMDVSAELPPALAQAWSYLQAQYLGPAALLRCYTNSHTYGVEGYPHTDSRRSADHTLVVYMNRHWQRDWGGETIVYSGNTIVHAELPGYNKGLVFPGAETHQARSVTRICPAQRITLMFKFAPPEVDPVRDQIQTFVHAQGLHKITHSGRNLASHLLNTYDILSADGHDQATCSGGAMHSIFGTNVFRTNKFDHDNPDHLALVTDLVGAEAAELAVLFSTVDRPGTLEAALRNSVTTVTTRSGTQLELNQAQLNKLCAIEAANLSDQKSLKKWPCLAQLFTDQ